MTKTEPLPEPGEQTRKAIKIASARNWKRRKPVGVKIESTGEKRLVGPNHADESGHGAHFKETFGTASFDFARTSLATLIELCTTDGVTDQAAVNAALAIIDGIRPDGEFEGALAVQIASTNVLALRLLKRAGRTEEMARFDCAINAATKLQRTMVAQVEALAKLRRRGEQNVTVRHVHVHSGGQAVVGNVSTGGARGRIGKRGQSDARALLDVEMRGEDAIGELLPIASGQREGEVPHARRG